MATPRRKTGESMAAFKKRVAAYRKNMGPASQRKTTGAKSTATSKTTASKAASAAAKSLAKKVTGGPQPSTVGGRLKKALGKTSTAGSKPMGVAAKLRGDAKATPRKKPVSVATAKTRATPTPKAKPTGMKSTPVRKTTSGNTRSLAKGLPKATKAPVRQVPKKAPVKKKKEDDYAYLERMTRYTP